MPTQQQQQQQNKKKDQGGRNQKGKGAPKLAGAKLARAVAYNKGRKYSASKVKHIQRLLGVKADGLIGPATTQAVYAFQVARSALTNDGMLGPATLKKLQASGQGDSRGGNLTVAQQNAAMRYNRQRNYKKATVRKIQSLVGTPVDGIMGRMTVNAIAKWQANKGIVADGKVGPATLRKMGLTTTQEPHAEPDPTPIDSGPVPRGNVTANFAWREFHCNDGTPVPAAYRDNVRRLAQQLEVIRAEFGGRPISINSAYRHPSYNKSIGGASNSQHLYAKAADFNVSGISPSRVRQTIEKLIGRGKMRQGGLGAYRTFTHYDIRGSRSRWSG